LPYLKTKNIIFDFDGVILNSVPTKTQAFRKLFKDFPSNLVEELINYHKINGGKSRYIKIKYFFNEILKQKISQKDISKYAKVYSDITKEELTNPKYIIKDTLDFIQQNYKKYNMHIASASNKKDLQYICDKLDLGKYFISINGSPLIKSKIVENIIRNNYYNKEETILIGDSINDYEASKENGIEFFGYNNIKLSKYGKANYIKSFKDFLVEDENNLNSNFEFSQNINSLFTHIKYLKKYKYKIAIYGNGLIGNIVAKKLKEQLVVIADKNKNNFSKYAKICTPEELRNYKFDKLVICVLGREEEIVYSLDIKKDKIFKFNFLNTKMMQIKNADNPTNLKSKKNYDVVFIPHKDYHLHTMALISKELKKQNISSCILNLSDHHPHDFVSKKALLSSKVPNFDLSLLLRDGINYKLLVCMCDWEIDIIQPLLLKCKKTNKKTLAIIEGINDFLDIDRAKRPALPYQSTEYLFLTGEHDKQFFKNKEDKCFIVGIPRLDKLLKEKAKFPKEPLVLINVNFSYGVLEDKREMWLKSVLEACEILNFEYIISQHPQDFADLSKYNVSKDDIYKAIKKASIVISRFGTTIIEALAMGKPVVYHNPHKEQVLKFQESLNAYSCSFDVQSLVEAIKYELSLKGDYRQRANAFLNHHAYINKNESSAKMCAKYIKEILEKN